MTKAQLQETIDWLQAEHFTYDANSLRAVMNIMYKPTPGEAAANAFYLMLAGAGSGWENAGPAAREAWEAAAEAARNA